MASTYQQFESSNRIVLSMETAEAKSDQRHGSNSDGSHTTKKAIVGMIFAGILLSAFLVVNWSSSSNPIGEVSKQNAVSSSGDIAFGNIVNNRNAYPFVVDMDIVKNGRHYVCTGNIVSPYWVLTAAHCVDGAANNGVTMVAGSLVRNPRTQGSQSRTSSRFEFHANSNIRDVALVRVSAPYDLSVASVGLVEISANRPAVGTQVTAVGWGTMERGDHTNNLRSATMNVISNAACRANDGFEICTQGGSGNTCGGDSGGPLLWTTNGQNLLVGLNSWSRTSCANLAQNMDVFESTPSYLNWVYGIVAIQYGVVYHLQNGYASWGGGYLDTRARGCEGNVLCVSTATSKNRDTNSGSWQIVSATGRAGAVKNGDVVYLINQYPNGGYLDTRGRGCEGNDLCVSTASTRNRDNGSGKWKIDADPAVTYITEGTPFHLKNEYANGNGGYLDTRARGCEGNDLCVSTSSTRLRDSGSTFWKFLDA